METGSLEAGSLEAKPGRGAAGGGGFGLQKIFAAIPLIPIVILSIIVIALSASAEETYFDRHKSLKGSVVSLMLLGYTPQAATLAIASAFGGLWYIMGKAESGVSAGSASALALVSWANGIVAFGFACRQSSYGLPGVGLAGILKALSGMTILLFLFETVYVILLHIILVSTS